MSTIRRTGELTERFIHEVLSDTLWDRKHNRRHKKPRGQNRATVTIVELSLSERTSLRGEKGQAIFPLARNSRIVVCLLDSPALGPLLLGPDLLGAGRSKRLPALTPFGLKNLFRQFG